MAINKNKFYISTPIYYPSGNLHIGHVYTTFMCDAIARYKRACGYDVFFLTGTDEHGQKIQDVAKNNNITPIEYVDNMANSITNLWKDFAITNDDFIRTTQPRHEKVVQEVFSYFLQNGDIYLGEYEGWYCKPCESFFTTSQLVDGKCPDCGREVTKEKEEAYFFKMSKYTDKLLDFYKRHENIVMPSSRLKEVVNSFIEPGLEDLCVSRTSFDWGVKVKENPKHVVYVWLDALLNYLSALNYRNNDETKFLKYWNEDCEKVHVLGKEITRFHLIYWPVFLMALNLPLPDKFLVHGWIVMKDGKMSKSKGNVVYPEPLKEMYGIDMLRYYLLREIPFCEDGIFTPEQFVERCNADLANTYGNLVHRSLSMIKKYFNGLIPNYEKAFNDLDYDLEITCKNSINNFFMKMDNFDVTNAISTIFDTITKANKYIEDSKPWALAKDETKQKELASVMSHLANVIYITSTLLTPFLIEGSNKVLDMLNVPENLRNYQALNLPFGQLSNIHISENITPVYARLDMEVEVQRMKEKIYSK